MGIESLVYRFERFGADRTTVIDYLRSRHATDGDREGAYVLATSDFWIDLQLSTTGPNVSVLRMRVAVTNPVAVVPVLSQLMDGLVGRFGGRIMDAAGRREFPNEGRLHALTRDYQAARELFIRGAREVTLPVSADKVFAMLREANGEGR